jgi:hypothetical protein
MGAARRLGVQILGERVRNAVAYVMVFSLLLAVVLAAGWGGLDVTQITTDVGSLAGLLEGLLKGVDLGSIREALPI